MVSPSITSINPFDAKTAYDITFRVQNATSYKNEIRIQQANNLNVVYNVTVGSGTQAAPNHFTIPANTLRNGIRYKVSIRVADNEGTWSAWSQDSYFYCFSPAVLKFTNVPSDEIIDDSTFGARVLYTQNEGEELQSYTFYLYDSNRVLLSSSDTAYSTYDIRYVYSGLESGSTYFIRVTGTTMHNLFCDSGYIRIKSDFTKPAAYSILYLTNYPEEGYITARSNVNLVNPDGNELYEYNNGWIDLRRKPLTYPKGFKIDNDFTMWVKIKDCYKNLNPLVKLENPAGGVIYLSSFILPTGEIYYRLTATPFDGTSVTPFDYIVYSNLLPALTNSDEVTICVRREHDIFDIKVWLNDEAAAFTIGKTWLGENSPVDGTNDVKNSEAYVNLGTDTDYVEVSDYYYSAVEPEDLEANSIWIGGE